MPQGSLQTTRVDGPRVAGAVPMLGMGLWWAWFLSLFFIDVGVGGGGSVGGFTAGVIKVGLMAGYAVAAVACLRPRVTSAFAQVDALHLLSLALMQTLASVVAMLAGPNPSGWALLLVTVLAGSLGAAVMLLLWAALFSRAGVVRSGTLFGGAVAIGGLVWFALRPVALVSETAYWGILATVPFLELAAYISADRVIAECAPMQSPAPEKQVRPTLVYASFGVVYGLLFGLINVVGFWAQGAGPSSPSPSVGAAAGLVVAGLWVYVYMRRVETDYIDYSRALKIPLIMVALGYALLVVFGGRGLFVAQSVAILGYLVFWQLYNAVWVEISIRSQVSVFLTSAWGFAVSAASIAAGALLGLAGLALTGGLDAQGMDHALAVVGIVAVFGLLVADMLLMDSSIFRDLGGMVTVTEPPAAPDAIAARVDELGERFGLTAREREIALMLARGRTPRYIADKLVISVNTVRTHIHHVYEKCGVHSDQELIDLVEP